MEHRIAASFREKRKARHLIKGEFFILPHPAQLIRLFRGRPGDDAGHLAVRNQDVATDPSPPSCSYAFWQRHPYSSLTGWSETWICCAKKKKKKKLMKPLLMICGTGPSRPFCQHRPASSRAGGQSASETPADRVTSALQRPDARRRRRLSFRTPPWLSRKQWLLIRDGVCVNSSVALRRRYYIKCAEPI